MKSAGDCTKNAHKEHLFTAHGNWYNERLL